ncbi:antibiotic resistance rRNA adenine methyltransferase [Streptomyces zinciresistens K42]|uniref:Antibiotic resistance rRNA adenine methyltransferase n=1 Tax=Streptomyces zinciresistens K42 TaxID=700597 RepID=G2GL87_9ACTN|nr:ErmE/ErmH/ErmO/ErmR family 23S rRNA (adenine(2058)-N(6))-methyltransferase [Streptomyces zinciresistens]EGX55728.1 antibiotic resistance rRNA adenine methyltransferase [Streptomyces zinciresistens K42]
MARPTRASRALSQNFLTDRTAAARLARLAAPPGVPVPLLLEVGAGKGALTDLLAPRCGRLLAYEIDPRLVPALRARFSRTGQVRVLGQDFLAARPPRIPFSVAGNVPFSRTADIVDWCLRAPALTDATLLTQLEYARKRTGDYGTWTRLTVLTWPRHEWRLAGRVARHSFRPVPRVDAGIVRIERRASPLLEPGALPGWWDMVELGFSGVGGSLHASLRRAHRGRRVDAAFRAARLGRGVLVGQVPPGAWLRLHEVLAP